MFQVAAYVVMGFIPIARRSWVRFQILGLSFLISHYKKYIIVCSDGFLSIAWFHTHRQAQVDEIPDFRFELSHFTL
jgi:hypothetical protein